MESAGESLNRFPMWYSWWVLLYNNHTNAQIISPKCRIYASVNRISICSDNGLSSIHRQAIIQTNVGLLSIGSLGTNFSEILIKIQNFLFTEIHLKISSAKWRTFCPRGDELIKSMTLAHTVTHHYSGNTTNLPRRSFYFEALMIYTILLAIMWL